MFVLEEVMALLRTNHRLFRAHVLIALDEIIEILSELKTSLDPQQIRLCYTSEDHWKKKNPNITKDTCAPDCAM